MTKDELLEDRTDQPTLTDEQFAKALRMGLAEFKAEGFVKRKRRRRGRPAKYRDLMSDDMEGMTVADAAELLSGMGD